MALVIEEEDPVHQTWHRSAVAMPWAVADHKEEWDHINHLSADQINIAWLINQYGKRGAVLDREYLRELDEKTGLAEILPTIYGVAISDHGLQGIPHLPVLPSDENVSLRLQAKDCARLLAFMFLGLPLEAGPDGEQGTDTRFRDFRVYLQRANDSKANEVHLKCLFDYFRQQASAHSSSSRVVAYNRQTLKLSTLGPFKDAVKDADDDATRIQTVHDLLASPAMFKTKCCRVRFDHSRRVGMKGPADEISSSPASLKVPSMHVSFANRAPAMGPGGSQEECLIGNAPELALVALLAPPMGDEEVITVSGFVLPSLTKGYGEHLEYVAPSSDVEIEEERSKNRWVVFMDAKDLSTVKDDPPGSRLADETCKPTRERDMAKALASFQMRSIAGKPRPGVVYTGHWGSGVFGGNRQVKALEQVIAASLADVKELVFCIRQDEDFERDLLGLIEDDTDMEEEHHVTVGHLLDILAHFASACMSLDGSAVPDLFDLFF
eukprot:Clim_evm39s142 gene=Clim_evmTU39s142